MNIESLLTNHPFPRLLCSLTPDFFLVKCYEQLLNFVGLGSLSFLGSLSLVSELMWTMSVSWVRVSRLVGELPISYHFIPRPSRWIHLPGPTRFLKAMAPSAKLVVQKVTDVCGQVTHLGRVSGAFPSDVVGLCESCLCFRSGLTMLIVIPKIDGKVNHHQISRDLLFHLFGDDYNYGVW